jgi:predicted MFS family arabinose efflux permease
LSSSPASGSLAHCLRLTLLLTVAHASFGGARLAITLQAVQMQASPLAIGILVSLIMVVPAVTAVPIGRWADRAGHEGPTLLGLLVLAAGEVLAWLVPGLLALAGASVLVGTGYTLAHVAVNHAIGRAAGVQARVRAFGIVALGFSVSALAGPMFAGAAIDWVGHARAFALVAVLPVVSAALMLGMPRSVPEPMAAGAHAAAGGLWRDPPLRAVLVLSGLVSMGWDLFTFLAPLHGARQGLSATAIGFVVGAFGVGSFAARLALPWLPRALDEWTLLRGALVASAAGYLLFPLCTTTASMLPLSFLLGLVLGCGQPMVMSLLHATAPPARAGEAVGLRAAITSAGQTALPLFFGGLGAALGMGPLFWTASAVLATGGIVVRPR